MKKLNFLLGLAVVLSAGLFTSCSDDETDPVGPSISFVAGSDNSFLLGDATIDSGVVAKFIFLAAKGDKDMQTVTIEDYSTSTPLNDADKDMLWDGSQLGDLSGDEKDLYKDTAFIPVPASYGPGETYTVIFTVTDKDGLTATKVVKITVATGETPLSTEKTAKILQVPLGTGTYNSFLDISTGTIYSNDNASANASNIDLGYYYGANNKATLTSPKDYVVTLAWATNVTKFVSTTSAYANITSEEDVMSIYNGGSPADYITNLSIGDVVVFKTAANEYGVLKVDNVTGTDTSTGAITVSYKIK